MTSHSSDIVHVSYLWLIVAAPLFGALINLFSGCFFRKTPKAFVSFVALGAMFVSTFASGAALLGHLLPAYRSGQSLVLENHVFDWIQVGDLDLPMTLRLDALSAVLLFMVTFIGTLIHLYSVEYMGKDSSYRRFFVYLNLFVASMLMLILGASLPLMFVGWEGVGACSYMLIGFWFDRSGSKHPGDKNARAGMKAFVVNRIGDFGVLLAMFVLHKYVGTLDFQELKQSIPTFVQSLDLPVVGAVTIATVVSFLLFIGATGKSAQIPLYVWLPDAMAGPTPVSALIHAATMVTAGVYMIARLNFLFIASPQVMGLIALIGAMTAFFAALIGFAQNDIKKVLAYSTVSQLGYMFVGVGVGAFSGAMFHVFTHAFFKACLFLGAGATIHALHEQQDIREMGGLRKHLPVIHWTFLISTFALAGIFPFSGFFSKDEILWQALSHVNPVWASWLPPVVYGFGLAGAFCTAFYMGRLYGMTFLGETRLSDDAVAHIHRPGIAMRLPLIVLAFGAATVGLLGIPALIGHVVHIPNVFENWLHPVTGAAIAVKESVPFEVVGHAAHGFSHALEARLMILSTVLAIGGFVSASLIFRNGPNQLARVFVRAISPVHVIIRSKFFIDELYHTFVVLPIKGLARFLAVAADRFFIDGAAVQGISGFTAFGSSVVRRMQGGLVQTYLVVGVVGLAALLSVIRYPKTQFIVSASDSGKPSETIHHSSSFGHISFEVNQAVSLSAVPIEGADTKNLEYRWDVDGDGNWDLPKDPHKQWGDQSSVVTRFEHDGDYRVVLRVRNKRWKTWRQYVQFIRIGTGDSSHADVPDTHAAKKAHVNGEMS